MQVLLRFTISLQDVVSLPMLLVARHAYSPSSSGNTSLIVRVATPFLFQTYIFTLPSLLQVICGSGSPSTLAVSSRCSPSLIMSSFVVLLDRDGLPVVSSFEPKRMANRIHSKTTLPPECRRSCTNFTCSSVSPVPTKKQLMRSILLNNDLKLLAIILGSYYCSIP
ncbi:hypothetical protein ALC53_03163 [Atta colombica]|uniref:Uncharacterized protein n=1 Tax=Atta colombica TaxID=520822 RepID=A0A151I5B3_9HYME|nr:hypothetical protein ALC53_03163 [Atta colombica]